MSDTPNLDRLLRARLAVMHGRTRDGQLPPVPEDPYAQEIIDFARKLERENADLREDNRKLALHAAAQAAELADLRAKLEGREKHIGILVSCLRAACASPFNLANSPHWQAAIDAAIAQGKGEK